ncbi:hypothetical protein L0Y47_22820 [Ectopseudomonas composti]
MRISHSFSVVAPCQLVLVSVLGSLLAACAVPPAALPTNLPDGQHYQRFQFNGTSFDYNGEWQANRPKGQGVGTDYDANGAVEATCKGEFGTGAYDSGTLGMVSAQGEIFRPDGSVIFRGEFSNLLGLAIGCSAGKSGTYVSPLGWTVTSQGFQVVSKAAGVWMSPGPCTLGDPQGNTWQGTCNLPSTSKHATIQYNGDPQYPAYSLPELTYSSQMLQFTGGGVTNFTLANGSGTMRYANGDKVEGVFDMGQLDDGVVRLTAADGKAWLTRYRDGKPDGARHMGPEQLASAGKACGFEGWRIVSGRCDNNAWSGDIDAYSADSLERISGPFSKGVPTGPITWSRLDSGLSIYGQMQASANGLGFHRGQVKVGGVQVYDGAMSGFSPNGSGLCVYEGSQERCEYANGARVDGLYKTRLENQQLRREMAATAEAQQAQQAQQQRLAAQQAAAAEQTDGDLFGKVIAIGIGAGAVSSVSGVSSTIRNQMITGMAADILTDGKAGGIATAQRNLAGQGSVGTAAMSSLQGATIAGGSSMQGSAAVSSRASSDASTSTLQNMAGITSGESSSHAARSQELDDIVTKLAADGGMKTLNATYQCAPGDPVQSVTVPYKSEACAAAKRNWFSVYACNDVEHMSAAIEQCRQGCGNPNCDEAL